MAKGGIAKLGKLKCMLKRWQQAAAHGKVIRHHHLGSEADDEDEHAMASSWEGGSPLAPLDNQHPLQAAERLDDGDSRSVPPGMRAVYVGKSRRRYLIGAHLLEHPLFRVLLQRSGGVEGAVDDVAGTGGEGGGEVVVGCEVVLFEHLLWMLENGGAAAGCEDPEQPESLDELVDFYFSAS